MLQINPTGSTRNGRLALNGRSLREVPADVTQRANTLRCLDLSANDLSTLSLPALPVLSELHLADNALDAVAVQVTLRRRRTTDCASALLPCVLCSASHHCLLILGPSWIPLSQRAELPESLRVLDLSANRLVLAAIFEPC